ncbi:hypothetical protein ACQEVF_52885 [Nonomuraea polychroma]|uniref:hypothetical protein n=1 Tax=Nonomuraea polychroma TaxID=46176 RepID=UPI003D8E78E7
MTDPVGPDLKRLLRSLKLGRLLGTLPERLALAKQRHLSHAAFLELALADEVTRRDTSSAALRVCAAGLDPGMRVGTWDESAAITYDRQPRHGAHRPRLVPALGPRLGRATG